MSKINNEEKLILKNKIIKESNRFISINGEIFQKEIELNALRSESDKIIKSVNNFVDSLGLSYPLAVIPDGAKELFVISKDFISKEKNII